MAKVVHFLVSARAIFATCLIFFICYTTHDIFTCIFENSFFREKFNFVQTTKKMILPIGKYNKRSDTRFTSLFTRKHVFLSQESNRKRQQTTRKCPPNSTEGASGSCVCFDGYFGYPNDKRGCFRCEPSCYEDETCNYPGICGCKFGQMKAENDECLAPLLRISNAYPTVIDRKFNERIIVEISPKEVTIRPLYCKFGNTIMPAGKGRKPGEIFCATPLVKKIGDTMLYVSDTRTQWPAHGVLIRVTKKIKTDFTSNAIAGTVLSTIMCIFMYFVSFKFFKSETAKCTRWRNTIGAQNSYKQFS